jgi:hypothetical protein
LPPAFSLQLTATVIGIAALWDPSSGANIVDPNELLVAPFAH